MKILLAEDDLHIRQGLTDMLTTDGYDVLACENGQVAVEQFDSQPVDFVILDVMMPVLDGYSVCRHIRQANADIPILFLTAKSEEIDTVLGLELGADDYLHKPFSVAELRARIRAIARRCQPATNHHSSHAFAFGDLMIYPDELCAKRGDERMELSLREISLLSCLYQHRGEVVTRDTLFDVAWGQDYLPNSRTLDQHISKLRKHIGNAGLIQTVHGRGYRYAG